MNAETINDFATNIVLLGAIPALAFVLIYGLGSPWYRSALGVVMMLLGSSIVIVYGIVIGRRLFDDYPGYQFVAIIGYSLLFLALVSLDVIVIIERRRPETSLLFNRKGTNMTDTQGGEHVAITTATVPEIWFKAKRAVRTIVQTLIVLVPIANAVAAAIISYLNDQTDVTVPGWVFLALNGIVVATALLAGLVARVMAVPGVNAWLVKIGLGSVPAAALSRGSI